MPQPSHQTDRTPYDGPLPAEFTATVTEIRELCRIAGKPLFQVALDRSAFEPATGLEGVALGSLSARAKSGAILVAPITAVLRDDEGELWHTTTKPLQPGTPVVGRCF